MYTLGEGMPRLKSVLLKKSNEYRRFWQRMQRHEPRIEGSKTCEPVTRRRDGEAVAVAVAAAAAATANDVDDEDDEDDAEDVCGVSRPQRPSQPPDEHSEQHEQPPS